VIDAANYVEPARDMWRALATKHGLALIVIECVVTDPMIHAARLSSRDRGLAIAEPGWHRVEEQGAEWMPWPEPHLRLDALEPIDRNVARAIGYVADQGPEVRVKEHTMNGWCSLVRCLFQRLFVNAGQSAIGGRRRPVPSAVGGPPASTVFTWLTAPAVGRRVRPPGALALARW